MTISLNEEQRAAAEADPNGILLVEALAGVGKTRMIRRRVPFLLRWRDTNAGFQGKPGGGALAAMLAMSAPKSKVLVMAYNKSVATEIDSCFKEELDSDDYKRVSVKTFHGQATSLLYRYKDETPVESSTIEIPKQGHLVQAMADWATSRGHSGMSNAELRGLLYYDGYARARGISIEDAFAQGSWAVRQVMGFDVKEVVKWVEDLRKFRYSRGLLTHDDTLPLANGLPSKAFADCRFVDVIADELQDLNFQQRELTYNFLRHAKSFTGTGDPNQTVHAWQGASPEVFNVLRAEYEGKRPVKTCYLQTTYRCSEPVIHVANQILGNDLQAPTRMTGIGNPGAPVQVLTKGGASLVEFLKQRHVSGDAWKDMAVLFRVHKHSGELEQVLAASGIPYVLIGNSFFEHAVVQDILSYMYLFYSPKPDYNYWRRVITHCAGLGSYTAENAWEESLGSPFKPGFVPSSVRNNPARRAAWDKLQTQVKGIQRHPGRHPAAVVTSLKEMLLPTWVEYYDPEKIEDNLAYVETFWDWVNKFEAHATGFDVISAVDNYDKGNRKTDPDADAVRVQTCHSAKGLEWRSGALWKIGHGTFPQRFNNLVEKAAEDRLLYVGITRFKHAAALVCDDEEAAQTVAITSYVPDVAGFAHKMLHLDYSAISDFFAGGDLMNEAA